MQSVTGLLYAFAKELVIEGHYAPEPMNELKPAKLHVRFVDPNMIGAFSLPRRYTLTHSDRSGERLLTIGREYDQVQVSGLYTRFMRDEILAEWAVGGSGNELQVHCHVNGGLVFGSAGWRDSIFRKHMRCVLEELRYGDREMYDACPSLDRSNVTIHFNSNSPKYNRIEEYGEIGRYSLMP